jgi:hypothetical protein
MEIDNWDAPDAHLHGRVIDSYTGANLVVDQNEWSMRIWERSWEGEATVNYQNIPIKADGTYNNTKLFAGTYDMLPYGGSFWPVDTVKGVSLKSTTEQDFTVTPYLQVIDFEVHLEDMTFNGQTQKGVVLTCKLKAPRRDGLPDLYMIQPFLSLTDFCGNQNYINISEYNNNVRIQPNKNWSDEMRDRFGITTETDTSGTYSIGPLPVKSGYTYNIRMGAAVNDANRKFNYSPIVNLTVP